MSYCFMNLRRSVECPGFEPDFPEGIEYVLLADAHTVDWGIYEFRRDEANDEWSPRTPVGDELAELIQSGTRYPPALALAPGDVERMFSERRPSQGEFAASYAKSLRSHLSRQRESRYVLARALGDRIGYLTRGGWYWVLKVTADAAMARWVSDDFFVYEDPVTDFELSDEQIEHLKGNGGA